MKKILLSLLTFGGLLAVASAEKIPLADGVSALVNVPEGWVAGPLPGLPAGTPAIGQNRRYVTKNGSNDSIMLTFVPLPDDALANPTAFREMVEEAAQRFIPGSVEGKAVLKEFKIGRANGYSVVFTDASLVGKPTAKEDYKTVTSCFVYLGNQLLLTATIFSDDVNGKAYAEAVRIVKSISLSESKGAI